MAIGPPPGTAIGVSVSVVQPQCVGEKYRADLFLLGELLASDGQSLLRFGRNTDFHIGSTSKTFTENLLARLTHNNTTLLDDPVSKYIPNSPTRGGQQILVRDLADYTSGLPSHPRRTQYSSTAGWNVIFPARGKGCWPAQTMVAQFREQRLMFKPGTQYFYSNWALGILSIVTAQMAGGAAIENDNQYDTYVREWWPLLNQLVLDPIGMRRSHVFIPFIDDPKLPTGYSNPATGTVSPQDAARFPATPATAGITTTPGDFQKYLLYKTPTSYLVPYLLSPLPFSMTNTGPVPLRLSESGQINL